MFTNNLLNDSPVLVLTFSECGLNDNGWDGLLMMFENRLSALRINIVCLHCCWLQLNQEGWDVS